MKKLFFISFLFLFMIGACKEGVVEPIPTPLPFIKKFEITPDSLVLVSGNPVQISWEIDNSVGVESNFGATSTSGKITVYLVETTIFYITGINSNGDKKTEQKKVTVSDEIKVGMFHQGGIVVSPKNKLISSVRDLPPSDWGKAVEDCENLTQNGYSDWFLPNIEQLEEIWRQRSKITNLLQYFNPNDPNGDLYFSITEANWPGWVRVVDWSEEPRPGYFFWAMKMDKWFVRPVRIYQ